MSHFQPSTVSYSICRWDVLRISLSPHYTPLSHYPALHLCLSVSLRPLSLRVCIWWSLHCAYCDGCLAMENAVENKMECRGASYENTERNVLPKLEIEMLVKVLVETWKLTSNHIYYTLCSVTFSLTLSFLSATHDVWRHKTQRQQKQHQQRQQQRQWQLQR